MRRTLTVLVTTAAFLLPAAAASAAEASAAPAGANASCSNSKGGNYDRTYAEYNGKGNARAAVDCAAGVVTPVRGGGNDGPPDTAL